MQPFELTLTNFIFLGQKHTF